MVHILDDTQFKDIVEFITVFLELILFPERIFLELAFLIMTIDTSSLLNMLSESVSKDSIKLKSLYALYENEYKSLSTSRAHKINMHMNM